MPETTTISPTDMTVTNAELRMNWPTPTPQARSKLWKFSVSGRPSGSVKISRLVLNAANTIHSSGNSTNRLHSETRP